MSRFTRSRTPTTLLPSRQTACAENDALYIPTDNTAASCTEAINNVAEPAGVPIVTGEEGICKGCGIATLSIDYYELGRTTGAMAAKILTGEANVSEMPIEYYQNPVKKYDAARCEALGIDRSVRLRCNRLTRNQTERR